MLKFLLFRLIYAVPIVLGVSIVCFSLVHIAPGSPLQSVLPPDASPEAAALIAHAYGFDQPLPMQYLLWLLHVLQGDLGLSIASHRPVAQEVLGSLSNTLLLAEFAVPLAVLLGCGLGAAAGSSAGTSLDRVLTGIAVTGISLPSYWLAIIMVMLFSTELMLLPVTGMGSAGSTDFHVWRWADARYLILPVVSLSLIPIGIIARTTRAAVAEIRRMDFVLTLRAKGLGEIAILRHVLKNALPPILAVIGLQFGYLVGGSILVETIFTWPGTGSLLGKAIINRDIPTVQGAMLVLSVVFVITNLLIDLLQSAIDPRIRRG